MSRTTLLRRVLSTLRFAQHCNRKRLSTSAALDELATARERGGVSRRAFMAASGASLAACTVGPDERPQLSRERLSIGDVDVGIVGAGLAGLVCADQLRIWGVDATLHEASERLGGRCWTLRDKFPGQVAERGGELIDNLHKVMLGYAKELGLARADLSKQPGDEVFFFGGAFHSEEAVVDEFRDFVAAMREDLRTLGTPTADAFTPADEALDYTDLASYLDSRGAGPIIKAALDVAYNIEYGLETSQQSCLNLLMFIHADKRSRFQPFGVFSDERYHLVGGNDAIVQGIANRLTGPVEYGRRLVKAQRLSDGRVRLTFKQGNKTVNATHDAVVLAIPFSTLRDVELDASLALPSWKRYAIDNLAYGTNTKLMIGFDGRPWLAAGSNGVAYGDLPHLQNSWETSPTTATAERAIITDYTGGNLGASLDPKKVTQEAERFLDDFDRVFPGAKAQASRIGGKPVAHMEHWLSNPLSRGSYTCNHPGYFTTICDNEAKSVDNLYFAGEHTSSFYEWQGFMEGAALSGLRAADEIRRQYGPG